MNGRKAALLERARRVKLVLTDCDGVLTEAGVWVSPRGEEAKRFSLRDGMGVERLRLLAGIETGIVTREDSEIVRKRAEKLGIAELHLGVSRKATAVREVAARRGLALPQLAFLGDDVNDLGAMEAVGFSACPADAFPAVKERAHFVCQSPGGQGAFREVAELILLALFGETPRF